jgi:hypothetical protein
LYSYPELPRREHRTGIPLEIRKIAPAVIKFTPEVIKSRSISMDEIGIWRSHPHELMGKCFITADMVQSVFIVDEYYLKPKSGPQYDVVFEDLGRNEVQVIDPETLLEMVAESELVVNALSS